MKTTRIPINTERLVSEDSTMRNWVMGGAPQKIEEQEAQGQQSFVNSETLPTDMHGSRDCNTRAILEAAGVKFVCEVPDDPMFQVVDLPQGWQKKATDHAMWSNLVDDKGRVRASIFYKAGFYDRSAHMSLNTRFRTSFDYDRCEKEKVAVANVIDGGQVVFTTEPIPVDSNDRYAASDKANQAAAEWLDQQQPDWRNPGAYWD